MAHFAKQRVTELANHLLTAWPTAHWIPPEIVGGMQVLKNGKFSCPGKGCHTVYEAREVIDQTNESFAFVRWLLRVN
jgi:hypothetical protein